MPNLNGQRAAEPAERGDEVPGKAAVELAACRDHDPAELADGGQDPRRGIKGVSEGGAKGCGHAPH